MTLAKRTVRRCRAQQSAAACAAQCETPCGQRRRPERGFGVLQVLLGERVSWIASKSRWRWRSAFWRSILASARGAATARPAGGHHVSAERSDRRFPPKEKRIQAEFTAVDPYRGRRPARAGKVRRRRARGWCQQAKVGKSTVTCRTYLHVCWRVWVTWKAAGQGTRDASTDRSATMAG